MYITFTNANGDSLDFFGSGYKLTSWAGFDTVIEINSEAVPYGDGEVLNYERHPMRAMTINLTLTGTNEDEIRQKLRYLKKLHSKNTSGYGYLTCVTPSKTYIIYVKPETVNETNDLGSGNLYLYAQTGYRALDPFFYDSAYTETTLLGETGGFAIPMTIPWGGGTSGDTDIIANLGDIDMPFTLTIKGRTGYPCLLDNTHSLLIQYNDYVNVGETLVISSAKGSRTATLVDINGVTWNVLDKISDDSTIFTFEQGSTSMTYYDIYRDATSEIKLKYHQGYNGI